MKHINTWALLLRRQGLVFVPVVTPPTLPERYLQAIEMQLATLGYIPSTRLRSAFAGLSLADATLFLARITETLAANLGANQKHTPLYRKFPENVPRDTQALWVKSVLVHFFQAEGQPCLFCRQEGTTHVLNPCQHVVCDRCFDGSNYSGCPVCGKKVDTSSPFFTLAEVREAPKEKVRFKLLDLGENLDLAAEQLFVSFCERRQALSPTDQEALVTLLDDYQDEALSWLPERVHVKEILATILGTLMRKDPALFAKVRHRLGTATDVLRLLAAYSGADPSLQARARYHQMKPPQQPERWWGKTARQFLEEPSIQYGNATYWKSMPLQVRRFQVAKLSRALRRAILAHLEEFPADNLTEDMLRHRSFWVWVGEFLHPHEYAARYPKVARAFQVLRKKAPDGTRAPLFQGYYGKLEAAAQRQDAAAMLALLQTRPGEFARRFDHTLRTATTDEEQHRVLEAFVKLRSSFSTPVLLTLHSLLPTRTRRARLRMYWPKGQVTKGVSTGDKRPTLPPALVAAATEAVEDELLRRFALLPSFDAALIDEALKQIIVPFNERTASPSAISLPRGSRIPVPPGTVARLFLHWCQPEKSNYPTDIDLSVGFYDASWKYKGVCSYYQLRYEKKKKLLAQSSGDFTSAPFPEGASEFVDIHRENALAAGLRYAVMVVNNYAGLPFSQLERGFAGVMLREDVGGHHFDPRTVTLKFSLQGDNGIFLPLVFDLKESTLHWLDVYSQGEFAMNNVATSNAAITRICPEMIEYFGSGVRASMYELALLHAAARASRVFLRGEVTRLFLRQPAEDARRFYNRLRVGEPDATGAALPGPEEPSVFAALYRGDIALYPESARYVLFPEQISANIAASDLLSTPDTRG